MEFTNNFNVPLPLEDAWKLMLDVPRILPCLPGAKLTEVIGDNKYRGSVSVKLGPIKLAFEGQAELIKKDENAHIAWLQGSGLDPKGRGAAQSEFSFALKPKSDGSTDVIVTTQLQLSGAVAQYGRGSGMIAEVASHILTQFEKNLADSLGGSELTETASISGVPQVPPLILAANPVSEQNSSSSTVGLATGVAHMNSAEGQILLNQAQAVLAQAQIVLTSTREALLRFEHASTSSRAAKTLPELNMLSIGLKVFYSYIKHSIMRLFGRKY